MITRRNYLKSISFFLFFISFMQLCKNSNNFFASASTGINNPTESYFWSRSNNNNPIISNKKFSYSSPQRNSISELTTENLPDFTEEIEEEKEKPIDYEAQSEREQLYEAYSLLHTLAQDFKKPFDAPAVIVVGHQTSGKSALIEALMGFQFNQVGGGTKTRRPIALRMQYNPNCHTPLCFLTLDNGKEEQKTLTEIQAYIEAENKRLERDPTRSFDPREINIRMEYKYSPNMIVIDTPGMIHAPKGRSLTSQQRAIAQASREAENLILNKIKCEDYIILCVEDTTDWKHATTRNIVMQVDPNLSRTVLVTTKFDTKLPQFSESKDLEEFIKAPLIHSLYSNILGGPFFTSVPSGRVGISKDYNTNEDFVASLKRIENLDKKFVFSQLMSSTNSNESDASIIKHNLNSNILSKIGISNLRNFLENRVEECYRKNVAKIIPLLQQELKKTENKLKKVDDKLKILSLEKLQHLANNLRENFSQELNHVIQGTVRASPEIYGETLETEQLRGGNFFAEPLTTAQPNDETFKSVFAASSPHQYKLLLENEVGNSNHKLYGGAQYHRAIREFTLAVRHMSPPVITEDEIANAAGMGDTHNGVNFMRAACVIAMEKAQISFDPMLEALRQRTSHIMKRLFPILIHLIKQKESTSASSSSTSNLLTIHNNNFYVLLQDIYNKFVDKQLDECIEKCRDDLYGMTQFVTWDVEDKSGSSSLYRLLPTPKRMVEIYNMAVEKQQQSIAENEESPVANKVIDEWQRANGNKDSSKKKFGPKKPLNPVTSLAPSAQASTINMSQIIEEDAELSDYYRVMQLTEEMLCGGNASRTSALVTSLVQFIISSWRNHFARSAAMKFNCFFLMPFMQKFPSFLREELDNIFSSNSINELFDVNETRRSLLLERNELLNECEVNSKLQERFDQIAMQIKGGRTSSSSSSSNSSKNKIFPSKPSFVSKKNSINQHESNP